MYYFYVLKIRQNGKLYKGYTNNLKRRLAEHRRGDSTFTSKNGIFDLVFYEAYSDERDARKAERYFKSGHGREILKDKITHSIGGVA